VTTVLEHEPLRFALDTAHEAHEPPEVRGLRRDDVRLLVSAGDAPPLHARFADLGAHLAPGDLLVVNTSATIPAALDARLPSGDPVVVHLSGALPGDAWLVEVRRPHRGATRPLALAEPVELALVAGGAVRLLMPFAGSTRLWLAEVAVAGTVLGYARRHGRAIRYGHVFHEWPLGNYQTVFGAEPGSAEMPSASHPFTGEVVTDLVRRGVLLVPVLLHTGVSSLEGGERPYPEHYRVEDTTAATINAVRARGGRVVAVGTTVVRTLATVTGADGTVHPGNGWTEVVVTPTTPLPAVDGLVTGWHEPEASHLWMLEAVAGRDPVERAYAEALDRGYLWHEFGDSHLLLRDKVAA
jgi:S-adenosylmethionine:tRNA ribosyltransferase-isomerase